MLGSGVRLRSDVRGRKCPFTKAGRFARFPVVFGVRSMDTLLERLLELARQFFWNMSGGVRWHGTGPMLGLPMECARVWRR